MAVARQWLSARYHRPGFEDLFDFNVYALCGDGCMMEGISSEAASLAGHWRLSNLCWIYDNNHITIEGNTALAFSEDVATRFLAYGWNVTRVGDANDLETLACAFRTFQNTKDRPTLIIVDSHIGFGAPHKQDTSGAHGEPLGEEEVRLAKRNYGWPEDEKFYVPEGVYEHLRQGIGNRGRSLRDAWFRRITEYRKEYPELAEELYRIQHRQLPEHWALDLPEFPSDVKGLATRESSAKVLNVAAKRIPWLIGGSADLAPSTKTRLVFDDAGDFSSQNYAGRNFHFGIREHAMGAIVNGLSLAKVRPFGSGFFIFTDYMRGAMRLSALMELPVVYIFTHDSIGVGEDGPTHQPIEHLAHMRSMPGLIVIRPADANEVKEAWKVILQLHHEPAVLVLTRQAVPTIDRTKYAAAAGLARGAYVLSDPPIGHPEVILIGTGSEVSLCLEAYEQLTNDGVRARVVSMPSWELFDEQDKNYRESVFPPDVKARVSVEEASDFGWTKYTGTRGHNICIESFGTSAPLKQLLKKFGFTAERVVAAANNQIALHQKRS
jgi:transketolase